MQDVEGKDDNDEAQYEFNFIVSGIFKIKKSQNAELEEKTE